MEEPESTDNQTFGSYTLVRELGRGAQGTVWLAEDQKLKRQVALKVVGAAPGTVIGDRLARLRREAEAVAKLDDPHICTLLDAGDVDGVPFLAFRYVDGQTLAECIERACERRDRPRKPAAARDESRDGGTTDPSSREGIRRVVATFEKLARALHKAHEHGLIHRDVKPGNVMITLQGEPVLLDFGLAREEFGEDHTLTHSGDLLGTPAYMSPEQLMAHRVPLDRRTDVYSLGATLYEALTLQRPYAAPTRAELYQQILHGTPASASSANGQIPRDLQVVLETAMEKDRNRRYQTAGDLADDLRRLLEFEPIRAKPIGPILRVRRWAQRHPATAVGAVAALLLLGSVTLISRLQLSRTRALLRHTEMLRLVATSEQAERHPVRAMALALEAYEVEASPEALAQVRRVLSLPLPVTEVVLSDRRTTPKLRASPQGDRLLGFWPSRGRVWFWDAAGNELARPSPLPAGGESVWLGFSASGRYAHVLSGGALRLFDQDGDPVDRGLDHAVHACAWLRGDRLAVAAADDGTVEILDVGSGRRETVRDAQAAPVTTNLVVTSTEAMAFGTAGALERWPVDGAGSRLAVGSAASEVAVSSQTRWIAACLEGGSLVFWDGNSSGEPPRVHRGSRAVRVHASPDGSRFLSYHTGGVARLWDAHGGFVAALERPDGRHFELAHGSRDIEFPNGPFAPTGQRLVTPYVDDRICIWDFDGTCLKSIPEFIGVRGQCILWSPTGDRLILGHNTHVRVVDVDGDLRQHLRTNGGAVVGLALLQKDTLWTAGRANSLYRWNLAAQPFRAHGSAVRALALSDGRVLTGSDDGYCKLWHLDGRLIRKFGPVDSRIFSVALSDDGRWLAAGFEDGSARLYGTDTEEAVELLSAPKGGGGVHGLVFVGTGGGRIVITRTAPNSGTYVWERESRVAVRRADGVWKSATWRDEVFSTSTGVSADPTGGFGRVLVLSGESDRPLELPVPAAGCRAVCCSPDGRVLAATGRNAIWVWQRQGAGDRWQEPPLRLSNPDQPSSWGLACSSDGKLLASGSNDGRILIWSIADGECVKVVRCHEGVVRAVLFLPGDREVISTGEDGFVQRSILDDDEVLERARSVPGVQRSRRP